MLNLGIIGPSPDWETRYGPALRRLQHRARITAVYDAVYGRAAQVAEEMHAVAVEGMRTLLDRRDVAAVLILDASWHGLCPLRFALDLKKAAYFAGPLPDDLDVLAAVSQAASERSVLLMPELHLRCIPATLRLKELTATQLGAIEQIDVDVQCTAPQTLMQIMDWCQYVVQSAPVSVESSAGNGSGAAAGPTETVRVTYRRGTSSGRPVTARICLGAAGAVPATAEAAAENLFPGLNLESVAQCRHGVARLVTPRQVAWQRQSEPAREESLSGDRSSVDLLLDHFIRRVVGALIPVADLSDVRRGWQLAHAAADSRRAGRPVMLKAADSGR